MVTKKSYLGKTFSLIVILFLYRNVILYYFVYLVLTEENDLNNGSFIQLHGRHTNSC